MLPSLRDEYMKFFNLGIKDLENLIKIMNDFLNEFTLEFHTKTHSVKRQSLQGILLENGQGNMTNYAKNVPGTNNQPLQNFISNSPWDEKPVIDKIQKKVSLLIGDKNNGPLHIDESAFKKSGKDSVRVKRQYCGRLEKVDNCQVGVFLAYAKGTH